MPPAIADSTLERDASEHPVDISSPANQSVNDDIDMAIPSPDSDNSETMTNTLPPAIDALQKSSPVPSSSIRDCPQQLNLTDERLAFAIASALSAVSTLDGPAVTREQEQPPKAQRKRHAKSVVVKQSLVEDSLPTVSNARPVKRKDQECIPQTQEVGPPAKKSKTKTPLEPSKRVSAR